ncbi:MAG TPA: hypothetical protein VHQ90_23285 [Thermoanaerobaculia bacterium]|nr:hypothetical protein [Thermoanaerobaculia bacterium]
MARSAAPEPGHDGESVQPAPRSALVVAHPGHELRLYHWLELNRPRVHVLTDGSGSASRSRLDSTRALLARAGAAPGAIFGRWSDRELYRALLAGDAAPFHALAEELAAELQEEGVDLVVGDAVEGYNPGHDAFRLVLNAAVRELGRQTGRRIGNYEFPLVAAPDQGADDPACVRLRLDPAALARKLAAARAYSEVAGEVERALARNGEQAFATEILRPVDYGLEIAGLFAGPPHYEEVGEERRRRGVYREVIRLREHLLPLAADLDHPHRPAIARRGAGA